MLEAKIAGLRDQLRSAEIVEAADGDVAGMGTTVTYEDEKSGKELSHKLVPKVEADPGAGLISIDSPVGKALAGRRSATTPRSRRRRARARCACLRSITPERATAGERGRLARLASGPLSKPKGSSSHDLNESPRARARDRTRLRPGGRRRSHLRRRRQEADGQAAAELRLRLVADRQARLRGDRAQQGQDRLRLDPRQVQGRRRQGLPAGGDHPGQRPDPARLHDRQAEKPSDKGKYSAKGTISISRAIRRPSAASSPARRRPRSS